MKKILCTSIILTVLVFSTLANATLVDNGGGLIYDSDLDITWLNETHMDSWAFSGIWAANLSAGGVTGWRMPYAMPVNGSQYNTDYVSYDGTTDRGYNIRSINNELAYLYYVTLGNTALYNEGGHQSPPGGGLNNKSYLTALQPGYYWTENSYIGGGQFAFHFGTGYQTTVASGSCYAMAVHDGNIGPDGPLPATYCVDSAQELHDALTTAQSNGEDDIIRIVQGTYNGNFIYASTEAYSLTVEGGYTAGCASRVVNPENTVLDAGGSGVVMALSSTANVNFVLDGLTFQNGNVTATRGSALFVSTNQGNVTVSNNLIINNYFAEMIGAYIVDSYNVTVSNNIIRNNNQNERRGFALGIYGLTYPTQITISNNSIYDNNAGGIWINVIGTATVANNTIVNNNALASFNQGAGICVTADSVILNNNTISNNRIGTNGGGGVILARESAQVMMNIIQNNSTDAGGGLYVGAHDSNATLILTDNVICNNFATTHGGGLLVGSIHDNTIISLVNNTISFNSTSDQGGGVKVFFQSDSGTANLYNNIIWQNTGPQGADLAISNDLDGNYFPTQVNVFNNNFDQSAAGIYIQVPFTIDSSNLDNVNPLFVDPANGDFHLQSGSPVINQGSNAAPSLPSTDKDDLARILYGIVDMGAYEFLCSGSYGLTTAKSGTGSGSLSASGLTCNGNTCNGTYACGTTITITASANMGSHFDGWSGCDSTDSNLCVVTMTGNKSVTATFTLNNYTLTVGKSGTGAGAITGTGISCGPDCTETYPYNTPVTITAIPDATSDFTGWTGCDSTNSNTCTVTMTGNRSVSASFTRRTHDLTVGKSGTGTGTVTGTGINCGPDCGESYVYGTVVNLTASANTGSTFTGWTGCDSVNSNICTVTMTSNKSVSASFALNQYILNAGKSGTGSGTITGTGISCGSDCTEAYNFGTVVALTATADTGSGFISWSGCDSPNGNTCTMTINATKSVSAAFTLNTYTLTATKAGTGSGSLTAPCLSCVGSSCTGTYDYNETVHITATADAGSVFGLWSGCDSVNGNVCSVLINGDRNVTATFYPEYTLLVNLEGTGEGRVVSTPSGIDCEPTCSDTFSVNTPVTLRAYPYGGSAFAYWSGVCTGTATTCDVTMTSYVEVTAHFVSDETKEYKLSVGKKRINKGDGLVQSDDGTISCGTVCTGLYYPNAPITLRATPSPGSLFEGWSPTSLNCGASPTCSFTMNSNAKVKAIFRGPYRLLTKIKTKNEGSGSVIADISGIGTGINCPASSCEDYYPYGNNVVLTVQPGIGSQFMGWKPSSLGCGTSLTCTVPMTKKQSVTATFEGI